MSFSLSISSKSGTYSLSISNKLQILIEKIEKQKIEFSTWESSKNDIQQYARTILVPVYNDLHFVLFQQFEALWDSLSKYEFSKSDLYQIDCRIQSLIQILEKSQFLSAPQIKKLDEVSLFYSQYELTKKSKNNKSRLTAKLESNVAEQSIQYENLDDDAWNDDKYTEIREQAKLKKKVEKRARAEKMAEQSLKKVYLKITAIIHPDREQDEIKKVEKTKLLQRANEAYEKQDLFFLLKMQIQVEQNQNLSKKALSEEQIKFYQLALEAQSQKLQSQIDDIIESLNWLQHSKNNKKKVKVQVSDIYKNIDVDTSTLKQQVKAEKERLKDMAKERGLEMLLQNELL